MRRVSRCPLRLDTAPGPLSSSMAAEHTPLKHVVIRLISQWFDEPLSWDGYRCQLVKSQIVPKMRDCLTMILLSFLLFQKIHLLFKGNSTKQVFFFLGLTLQVSSSLVTAKGSRTCGNFPSKLGIPNGWSWFVICCSWSFRSFPKKYIDDVQ